MRASLLVGTPTASYPHEWWIQKLKAGSRSCSVHRSSCRGSRLPVLAGESDGMEDDCVQGAHIPLGNPVLSTSQSDYRQPWLLPTALTEEAMSTRSYGPGPKT